MKSYDHRTALKSGIVLVNLGTPADTSPGAIRSWLGQFLSDQRVVEIPGLLWWPILHGIILRARPKKLSPKYSSIAIDGALPLRVYSAAIAKGLEGELASRWPQGQAAPLVGLAMTYGKPSISETLDAMADEGVSRFLILPMYPQYSATTTAPVYDQCFAHFRARRYLPECHIVHSYHKLPAYIDGIARSVRAHWQQHGRADHLLMSFHGLPLRNIREGDPYFCQSHASARLLRERLELDDSNSSLCFQSRFGAQKWLEPYTADRIKELARAGTKSLEVLCPGFACDCLETLDEIAIEGADDFRRAGGGDLRLIPCLNDSDGGIKVFTELALMHQGWLVGEPDAGPAGDQQRRAHYEHAHATLFGDKASK